MLIAETSWLARHRLTTTDLSCISSSCKCSIDHLSYHGYT